LIIDPRTESKFKKQFEEAVASLEWGTIAINEWAAFVNGYGILPWGAFPKHDASDIQSGQGKVGNAGLYINAQKCVLRNQFISKGHLPLPSDPKAQKVFVRLSKYSINPSWTKVFGLSSAALLGI